MSSNKQNILTSCALVFSMFFVSSAHAVPTHVNDFRYIPNLLQNTQDSIVVQHGSIYWHNQKSITRFDIRSETKTLIYSVRRKHACYISGLTAMSDSRIIVNEACHIRRKRSPQRYLRNQILRYDPKLKTSSVLLTARVHGSWNKQCGDYFRGPLSTADNEIHVIHFQEPRTFAHCTTRRSERVYVNISMLARGESTAARHAFAIPNLSYPYVYDVSGEWVLGSPLQLPRTETVVRNIANGQEIGLISDIPNRSVQLGYNEYETVDGGVFDGAGNLLIRRVVRHNNGGGPKVGSDYKSSSWSLLSAASRYTVEVPLNLQSPGQVVRNCGSWLVHVRIDHGLSIVAAPNPLLQSGGNAKQLHPPSSKRINLLLCDDKYVAFAIGRGENRSSNRTVLNRLYVVPLDD